MDKKLLSIGETAKMLGVSIDTLRRWDKNGKLRAIRFIETGNRYYRKEDIDVLTGNPVALAEKWVYSYEAVEPAHEFYCATRDVFQARLQKLEKTLSKIQKLQENFSLISAISGEIGNNSYDHNLGNWPDIPGIFFAHDVLAQKIVLADRGQGILKTLKRVKPELTNDSEALKMAFTDKVSARAPEARGNGLKFVRKIITKNSFGLLFKTGNAELLLGQNDSELNIAETDTEFHGCFAVITF